MAQLDISLLGPLHITRDGHPVTDPGYAKVLALLVFLAVESDRPHQRGAIAGLLWPEQPEERARHSLRQALTTLRRMVGQDVDPPCLLIERETIAFNPDAGHTVDVRNMQMLLAERQAHGHADPATCLPCTRRLEDVAALYRGEFLQGFSVPDSDEFENWALMWRQRLQDRALQAMADLAASYRTQGDDDSAINVLRRQLEIDPVRESAQRELMTLLWRTGNRTGALAQYARFEAVLDEELGVEPEPETTALYEAIRDGEVSPAPRGGGTTGGTSLIRLPVPPTRMIGRETEANDVIDLLSQSDCRLLTIIGSGGSGKTRLALHVASEIAKRSAGVICFVPLASARDAEGIVAAIAAGLGLRLQGKDPPDRQLLAWLRERSALLVLDNLEHLVDHIDIIPAMLATAPDLTLLVTSREWLSLTGEWVYNLSGLAFPRDIESDGFEGYEAVELLTERLRHVRSGTSLRHEERRDAIRICQLVDGMPLALELAAAWANTLTLREIADGIRENLDFLSVTSRDQPDRHRSMRAVCMSSWEMLTTDEQAAWRRLSVFENGFTLNAAEHVAGATIQSLAALINKSLLTRLPSGRYRMHGLLVQFGDEMLCQQPDEHARILERHSRYYLNVLAGIEEMLVGRDQHAALRTIGDDIDNIREAWQWAIRHGLFNELVVAAPSLWLFFAIHGWMREGEATFAAMLDALAHERAGAAADDSPRHMLALGMAMAYTGGFRSGLGRYDEAIGLLTQGISLLREQTTGRITGLALNMLAAALSMKGQYTDARDRLQESLEEFDRLRDAWGKAFSLNDLGMVMHLHFHDETGEHYCEQSRTIFRQVGDHRGQAFAASCLGLIAMQREDYRRAKHLHHEALALREESDDRWGVAASYIQLGKISALMDDGMKAREHLRKALGIAWESSIIPVVLDALTEMAALDVVSGDHERARETLFAVAGHPAIPGAVRVRVTELAHMLGEEILLPEHDAGEDRWAIRVVNDVARSLVSGAR